jgi:hypothetical protein
LSATYKENNMTRKHFIAIARVINRIPDLKIRGTVAREMADELAGHNNGFDRLRFIEACGA